MLIIKSVPISKRRSSIKSGFAASVQECSTTELKLKKKILVSEKRKINKGEESNENFQNI